MTRMSLWEFLFILFYLYLLHGTDSARDSQQEPGFAEYCPSDFECSLICDSYQTASSQCSCHPACRLFGDCCYNHQEYTISCPLNNGGENLYFDTLLGYKDNFKCTFDAISKERYWMVSKCPETWNELNQCDDEEDKFSYKVGRIDKGISSIPVVSSDGITFRNVYCAVCHGKDPTELTPWSFQAEGCKDTDIFYTNSTLSVKEKVEFLVENCKKVAFLPPSNHSHHSLSVIPCRNIEFDVIDICNNTAIAESIIKGCSTVAAPIEVNGKHFKNTFCIDCYFVNHVKPEIAIKDSCLYNDYSYESSHLIQNTPSFYSYDSDFLEYSDLSYAPPWTPLVPISITFNFGGQKEGVYVSKAGKNVETIISVSCNVGQVYDPLESKCVQLLCPDGYHLSENLCVKARTIDNSITSPCERFALSITVSASNISSFACSSEAESLFDCLQQDLAHSIETTLQHNNVSCSISSDKTQISFYGFEITVHAISKFLSPSGVKTTPKTSPKICNSIGFVEMNIYCASFQSNTTLDCSYEWLNDSLWLKKENSTGENVITNLSDNILISEVKIQHHLSLSESLGSVATKNISVLRCRINHDLKLSCPFITLDSSWFEQEGKDSNILLYSKNKSIRLTPDMYNILHNGSIQVCNFLQNTRNVKYTFFPKYPHLQTILSTIGLSLSIICVSFTLVTYIVFPTLRSNLANILIMTLCACLLPAQMVLIFAGVAAVNPLLCAVLAGVGHFAWLSVFTTSSMLGLTLKQTFTLHNQAVIATKPSRKTLMFVLLICFGVPSVISGTLLLLYLLDGDTFGIMYGSRGGCWIGRNTINLFAFGLPVAVCLVINLVFFLYVTLSIFIQARKSGRLRKSKQHSYRREVLIYIKIFMILGLTWVTGFMASFTNIEFLWYLFTILTSFQGVFILLAFTLKSKIWNMWRERLGVITSSTTTPKQNCETQV